MNRNLVLSFQVPNPDIEQESKSTTDDPTRSEIDKDYISKLPDDVLLHILLIHPMDSGSKAVALFTGILDRPWITNVKIQDFGSALCNFLKKFDKRNPVLSPRKIEFHLSKNLIVNASFGLNRLLNLDFSKANQEFPRQFGLNTMDLPRSSPYPFSVKTLKLTSVNYLSRELVSSSIRKFRHVKRLIIENCHGLRSLRIEGLPKLTHLSVLDCVDLKSLHVEASVLKSLRYSGFLCWFSLKNVADLTDVKLDIKGLGFNLLNHGLYNPLLYVKGPWFNHLNHRLYNPLLKAIQDVTTFTLHGWMCKEFFGPLLSSNQHKKHFKFNKLEDLCWIDSCMEDQNINALFGFLKFCSSLKRLFIRIDTPRDSKSCVINNESTIKVHKGRLRNLEVVKMKGFKKEVDIMLFKEHLMEVFDVKPQVIEVRKGMHDRCLIRIFPKRQASGKVPKSDKLKYSYMFVEVD